MKKETRKIVSEGNAYYELDMDCIEKKKTQKNMEKKRGKLMQKESCKKNKD